MKKKVLIKRTIFVIMLICLLSLASCHFKGCNKDCKHEWDSGALINATTCGENVKAEFTCTRCGQTEVRDAFNHNYLIANTLEPTCTRFGYTTYECTLCDTSCSSEFVSALGHNYGEQVVVEGATCTSAGISEQVCSNCGEAKSYNTNATGHSYVPVSDGEGFTVYECQHCLASLTVEDGDSVETQTGTEEIFDVDIDFSFDIVTDGDEEYIRQHLYIVDDYLINTEYENNGDYREQFTVENKGNGVWTVKPSSAYRNDTSYTVKMSGDVRFEDYNGDEMTFTTENDENHENVVVYRDDIIYLRNLENTNSGYYPYSLSTDEQYNYLYLTVGKIDGIVIGQVLCIGEATCPEEFTKENMCYFGKVDSYYSLPNGQYMVVLSTPELHEVFSEFDVSARQDIEFDPEAVDIDQVEDEIVCALYSSDDFVQFLSVVNVSATNYFNDRSLDTSHIVSTKSFLDYIKIDPTVNFDGSTLLANIVGTIDVPIIDSNKRQIGSFKVNFLVELNSTFAFDVKYQLRYWWFIPTGIEYFDISLIQTDTINFEFNVEIDIDYSLEEHRYVQNLDPKSLKIHRRGCPHLVNVKDTSKWKGLSATEVEEILSKTPSLGCKHCQPLLGLQSELLLINKSSKVIHVYGCMHIGQMSEANKLISDKNASYWMKLNEGYTCCDWCHPDAREELEYSAYYESTLYCSDWQQIATDLSQQAKDSGLDKYNEAGITLARVDVPIFWPLEFSVEVSFVFSLKLEASLEYKYSYEQQNVYGVRIQGGAVNPYNTKTSQVLANELTLMGKLEVRAGILVDANLNIWGLSQWIRAGITAEVGLYARLSGILHLDFVENENYAAAYFEAGIYLDINAYYQLFGWWGETSIYSNEWPLILLGYEKAYFGYETYHETLEINNSYDIAENDLLKVKYFDLKTMETKTDELSLDELSKYRVTITFENGQYCRIENGVIVATADAPCYFTDQITITVESDDTWHDFKKGSAVYYLKEYIIDIEMHSGASHDFDTIESNLPSCEDPGNIVQVCSVCNIREETVLEALGHTEIYHDAQSPTCVDVGWYSYVECSACQYSTYREIPAIGHNYVNRECLNCGDIIYSEGLEFTSNGDGTCYVASMGMGIGTCTDTDIRIPPVSPDGERVTGIGAAAFGFCTSLTSVAIPDGVTTIGDWAFYACDSLTSITIPDSVTSIGDEAFHGCDFLTSLIIPDGVTSIGDSAFYQCGLVSVIIPDSVTSMGEKAFWNSRLTSVTIGNGVTSIGNSAFESCFGLTSVTIGNGVTTIGDGAFARCTSLTSVTIGDSVTTIGNSAFSGCDSLTSVTIPDSVTTIGNYAFANCDSLTSVTIPDSVTTIGNSAFSGCDSLTSVTIGGSVTTIGGATFYNCTGLTSVTIPESVTTIGDSAFSGCDSLTSVTIPDSVTNIDNNAFSRCTSLTSMVVDENNLNYKSIDGNLYTKDGKTLVRYAIGKTDTQFIIPDSVTTIDVCAFDSCTSLTSVTIGNGVTTIGDDAFAYCSSLTSVTIPNSVTTIGDWAFYRCDSLTSIYYEGTVVGWNAIEFGQNWNYIGNYNTGTYTIYCTDGEIAKDGTVIYY